jgi:cytochrome b involved in lipid metabolism
MALKGVVYDITVYAQRHPGGVIIYDAAGADGTILYSKQLLLPLLLILIC